MPIGTESSFATARQTILQTLKELATGLTQQTEPEYKFQRVSNVQAVPAMNAFYRWQKSGKFGPQPVLPAADLRAVIYAQAHPARQLEAFIRVSKVSALELASMAIDGFEQGSISIPFVALRGLVERIATVAAFTGEMRVALDEKPNDIQSLLQRSEDINRVLHGTRIAWDKIRNIDLRKADAKEVSYVHKELTANSSARNILSAVDKLEKQVKGIRIAYDVLCEFLHPNVGDLFACTTRATTSYDNFKTRHLTRNIGNDPKNLEGSPDLNTVLGEVVLISADAVKSLASKYDELSEIASRAVEVTKKHLHLIRSNYSQLFRASDYCPCLSGLKVRDCR